MSARSRQFIRTLVSSAVLLLATASLAAPPTGAKAIFDSGEGGTIGMSVNAARPSPDVRRPAAPVETARYVGISYQIMAIDADGQMRAVSKNRIFRTGERVKILARTNRPGYLTVANIGSSGRMHVLFSEYVDAGRITEIPPASNLRFDANPGTEKVLIMLSNEPSPFAPRRADRTADGAMPSAPPVAYTPPAPLPSPSYGPSPSSAAYPPPPPMAQPGSSYSASAYPLPPDQAGATMVASLSGAKALQAKGAKDLLVDDAMQSSYTVVSPKNGFKPVSGGAKDLVLESAPDGMNYGVVPVSAISDGGILTLEIKLTHR